MIKSDLYLDKRLKFGSDRSDVVIRGNDPWEQRILK